MVLVVGVEIPAAEDVRIQRVGERASKEKCRPFSRYSGSGANATWRFNDKKSAQDANGNIKLKRNCQTETELSREPCRKGA